MSTVDFANIALEWSGEYKITNSNKKCYSVENEKGVREAIRIILKKSNTVDVTESLEEEITEAASKIKKNPSLGDARKALSILSEDFENYLQVIAAIKYSHEEEILKGGETHKGYLNSSLGSLIHGNPKPKREYERDSVPKRKVINFNEKVNSTGDYLIEKARKIRNDVHKAKKKEPSRVFSELEIVLGAYLKATEDNIKAVVNKEHIRSKIGRRIKRNNDKPKHYIESRLLVEGEEIRANKIVDILKEFSGDTIGIYGEPGAGKSTLAQIVQYRLANDVEHNPIGDTQVPVMLKAKNFTGGVSVEELVTRKLSSTLEEKEEDLDKSGTTIIIDGLNEVRSNDIRRVLSEIRSLRIKVEEATFVLTSRKRSILNKLDHERIRVLPFVDKDIKKYIDKRLDKDSKKENLMRKIEDEEGLYRLSRNPMMLFIVTEILLERGNIPENKGLFLKEFFRNFLKREQKTLIDLKIRSAEGILAKIATRIKIQSSSIEYPVAEEEVKKYINSQHIRIGTVDAIEILKETGIIEESRNTISFKHELYTDYFAACELNENFAKNREIEEKFLTSEKWRRPIVLLYGITNSKKELKRLIKRVNISLLADCIAGEVSLSEEDKKEIINEAKELIRSNRNQPEAIDALATFNSSTAFENITDLLDDSRKIGDYISKLSSDPLSTVARVLKEDDSFETIKSLCVILDKLPSENIEKDDRGKMKLSESILHIFTKKGNSDVDESKFEYISKLAKYARPTEDVKRKIDPILHRKVNRGVAYAFYQFTERFGIDLSERIRTRVLSRSIKQGADPDRVPILKNHKYSDSTLEELYHYALIYERPLWLSVLDEVVHDSSIFSDSSMTAFAEAMFDQGSTRASRPDAEEIFLALEAIGDAESARNLLSEMLLSGRVPISSAYQVAELTEAHEIYSEMREEYIRRANQARAVVKPSVYAEFCRWCDPGDVRKELLLEFARQSIKKEDYDYALAAMYATGLENVNGVEYSDISGKILQEDSRDMRSKVTSKEWILFELCWDTIGGDKKINFIKEALQEGSISKDMWCSDAISRLKDYLTDNENVRKTFIRRSNMLYSDSVRSVIFDKIKNSIREENIGKAIEMMQKWKIHISDVVSNSNKEEDIKRKAREVTKKGVLEGRADYAADVLNYTDAKNDFEISKYKINDVDASTIVKSYQINLCGISHVDKWIENRISIGKIEDVQRIAELNHVKEIREALVIPIMEMVENERYLWAARLINTFNLHNEFKEETQEICEKLLELGKGYTKIKGLIEKSDPETTIKVGQEAIKRAKTITKKGNFDESVNLLEKAGFSYLLDELKEWTKENIKNWENKIIELLLSSKSLTKCIPQKFLKKICLDSELKLKCKLDKENIIYDKGFCFLESPIFDKSIFLHASNYNGDFDKEIESNRYIYAEIREDEKGFKAFSAVPQNSYDIKTGEESFESDTTKAGSNGDFDSKLDQLADNWNASLDKD